MCCQASLSCSKLCQTEALSADHAVKSAKHSAAPEEVLATAATVSLLSGHWTCPKAISGLRCMSFHVCRLYLLSTGTACILPSSVISEKPGRPCLLTHAAQTIGAAQRPRCAPCAPDPQSSHCSSPALPPPQTLGPPSASGTLDDPAESSRPSGHSMPTFTRSSASTTNILQQDHHCSR